MSDDALYEPAKCRCCPNGFHEMTANSVPMAVRFARLSRDLRDNTPPPESTRDADVLSFSTVASFQLFQNRPYMYKDPSTGELVPSPVQVRPCPDCSGTACECHPVLIGRKW